MNNQLKKIYIIDDDISVIEVLYEYLKLSDFEVYYSLNPIEALKDLPEKKPDIILLDLNMPEMNGFDVLKKIRANDIFKDTGVILLTSHDHINYKIKGLEEGADDYVTKPFQKAEVLARIRSVLRRMEKQISKENMDESDLLKGDLSKFSLIDLLQFFDINKKSGTIKLIDIKGEIELNNGFISKVFFRDFPTEEALKRLLIYNYGRFEVDFNIPIVVEKSLKISDVLLDIISYIDELKRDLGPELNEGSVVKILDKTILSKFNLEKEEIDILELLSIYPYDLKEGVWILKNLLENNRITIKDGEK